MNLVGKIFVMLIMVMSLLFMGFALAVYSTHTNWKLAFDDVNKKLQTAKTQLDEVSAQRDNLQMTLDGERVIKQRQLAALETEKNQLQNEFVQNQNRLAQAEQDRRDAVGALDAAHKTLEARIAEVAALRDNIRKAEQERDNQFNQSVKLTDDLNQATGELDRLKNTNMQLTEQVAKAKLLLDRAGQSIDSPVDGIPPRVNGRVLASMNTGLIEVSIGSDDGLERGHTLEVYRQGPTASRYLGRFRVVKTEPDKSVAEPIPGFRKGAIEKEDRVTTRFR